MRTVLRLAGYTLDPDAVWRKKGAAQDFPDARVEEDHFRVLIETLSDQLLGARANRFLRKLGGESRHE
jgi:hypothetical protein